MRLIQQVYSCVIRGVEYQITSDEDGVSVIQRLCEDCGTVQIFTYTPNSVMTVDILGNVWVTPGEPEIEYFETPFDAYRALILGVGANED